MKKIKYVQLDAAAFLSDEDFQMMSAEERGIYCTVNFYMYCNNGRIKDDPSGIQKLSNANSNFEKSWERVKTKFYKKGVWLRHKRVDSEIKTAKERQQMARNKGLKGAKAKWHKQCPSHSTSTNSAMTKVSKGKVSKDNIKEKEKKKKFIPPTLQEVEQYCREKGLTIDPRYVWEFYENKGWKVGKVIMKDWRIAVGRAENWENAPRVKRQPTPQDEAAALENKRREMREQYGAFIREADEKKLITVYKEQINLRWLIRELRPEIMGKL
jgi:uncharacterized protein YdaU (DUF1376 family)